MFVSCVWTNVCARSGECRSGWCVSCDCRMECVLRWHLHSHGSASASVSHRPSLCVLLSLTHYEGSCRQGCRGAYGEVNTTFQKESLRFCPCCPSMCCKILHGFGHSVKHLLSAFTEAQSKCWGIRGCCRWLQNLSISLKHIYLEVKIIHFMVILLRLTEPSENEAKPHWTHYHSWSQALCVSKNAIWDAMQFALRCGQQQLELNVG